MNADRLEAENRAEELNFATLDNDVWDIVPTWPDYDEATTAAADPYEGNVVVLTSGQTLVFDPQTEQWAVGAPIRTWLLDWSRVDEDNADEATMRLGLQ